MWNTNQKKISILLLVILALEALSFLSLSHIFFGQLVFIALIIATLLFSIYRLEYGLLIVLAELFVGSMGHLFMFPLGTYQLPIRIALWLLVVLVFIVKFLVQLLKHKEPSLYWQKIKNFPLLKYFGLLFLFIMVGLFNGLLRQHGLANIFTDFNAWPYFLLLFPIIVVYYEGRDKVYDRLRLVFLASAIWVSLETLALLFVFTHNTGVTEIYNWLRRTIVGEVTPTLSGWPRVFIQGQIYPIIAFLLLFWKQRRVADLPLAALFLSSVLISFSRSFWVGLAVAIIFSLILLWRFYSLSRLLKSVLWTLGVGLLSFLLIYLIAVFPCPQPGAFNADFLSRLKSANDAALASRWSLLPALAKQIERNPLLGQGYGATVTYYSRDPRILQQSPSGLYTTSAFEWGYLDLWLKLGILGLLAYLLLLYKIIKIGIINNKNQNYLVLGISASIVFLAVTNIFTPYLNHPLGMGFFLISSCLILRDRVY